MAVSPGTRLGPYEIVAPLGAGGMGEVYRARDERLKREVAVKILPASYSADADRLRRFEQEAQAAGSLNHPNILAIYDVGTHDGNPYVVSELLEGETLRAGLAVARLPARKAVDYAVQAANGLAAAHEKGIVHRDLKPDNLFVTRDGRIKILDFGLAKLVRAEEQGRAETDLPTATPGTEPGIVLGTLGYMSPEQVRGMPADARSDIFAFGAILYEMLSGRRAFQGGSSADTMSAILREDPPDLSATNQSVSPGLERIVRHCLEKNPEQRFHSAHDLAFDLQALTGVSAPAQGTGVSSRLRAPSRGWLLAAAGAIALAGIAFLAGRRLELLGQRKESAPVLHRRLTFRRGNVLFARFTPDGQNVVYGAACGGRPAEIFLAHVGSPESRPLGISNANLLSVSPAGELAILLKKTNVYGTFGAGTLARVPLTGGAPREILEDVIAADWSPDGTRLAVFRGEPPRTVLEYPIGKRLYTLSPGRMTGPRISPDGNRIAVGEPSSHGSRITVVGADGEPKVLTELSFIDTLAWHPSGREIWFVGGESSTGMGLRAVDLAGRSRIVAQLTDLEVLHDITPDGRALVEREIAGQEIVFSSNGEPERNLSWLESSELNDLSADGRLLLFTESAEGGGDRGSVYIRKTDGSPAVRLGDGEAHSLSPDGRWALSILAGPRKRLMLLPTGAGEPKAVDIGELSVLGAMFLPPDGRRLLVGTVDGKVVRAHVLEPGRPPRLIFEGMRGAGPPSPDGQSVILKGLDEKWAICPVAGGPTRPLTGIDPRDQILQWSADGETLYLGDYGQMPLKVFRYRIATAAREVWKEFMPADRAGVIRIQNIAITPDGSAYAYSFGRVLASDLFVVSGWK